MNQDELLVLAQAAQLDAAQLDAARQLDIAQLDAAQLDAVQLDAGLPDAVQPVQPDAEQQFDAIEFNWTTPPSSPTLGFFRSPQAPTKKPTLSSLASMMQILPSSFRELHYPSPLKYIPHAAELPPIDNDSMAATNTKIDSIQNIHIQNLKVDATHAADGKKKKRKWTNPDTPFAELPVLYAASNAAESRRVKKNMQAVDYRARGKAWKQFVKDRLTASDKQLKSLQDQLQTIASLVRENGLSLNAPSPASTDSSVSDTAPSPTTSDRVLLQISDALHDIEATRALNKISSLHTM